MSDYTPAPWTIDDTQKYYPKSCIRHRGVIICHLPTLADSRGAARLEDEANARLIAAAPELLEACKQLVMQLEYVAEDDLERAAIQDGLTAIAKAEPTHPADCQCELCRTERAAAEAAIEIPH